MRGVHLIAGGDARGAQTSKTGHLPKVQKFVIVNAVERRKDAIFYQQELPPCFFF